MNVKNTLKRMIWEHPLFTPTRETCLVHMFCVLGTGFSWKEGQLVHGGFGYRFSRDDTPEKRAQKLLEEEIKRLEPISGMILSEKIPDFYQKRNDLRLDILRTVDQRVEKNNGFPKPPWIYPLCELSNLTSVPNDVQKDWLEAARETLGLVLGIETYETPEGLREASENREWALKTKLDLEKRFPE